MNNILYYLKKFRLLTIRNCYTIFTFSLGICLSFMSLGQTAVPFTANTSWVVPAGVTSITIHCWGGGGGGGGTTKTSDSGYARGGGGGGGAYSTATITVVPTQTCTIVVGGGGAGGSTSGGTGVAGGLSSVTYSGSVVCSAAGGAGGTGRNSSGAGTGGAGGSSGVGYLYKGGNGANPPGDDGGGGGGGAGSGAVGSNGANRNAGNGGTGTYPGGNGGTGADWQAGSNGNARGGGGGGAMSSWANESFRGGNGARGEVIIVYNTCTPPPPPIQVAANILVGPTRDGNVVGLGSPLLADANLTGGDGTHHAWWGRLFNPLTGGVLYTAPPNCWLETYNGGALGGWKADVGAVKNINGVILQGRPYSDLCTPGGQYTSSVTVYVSSDNVTWTNMGTFAGNTNAQTIKTIIFPSVVQGRYVRIDGGGVFRADVVSIPCGAGSHSVSVSAELPLGATNIRWYNAPTGGTLLGTGLYYTATITQNTTFYAAAYNGSCESTTRVPVTAVVGQEPAGPSLVASPAQPTCGASATIQVGAANMIPEPRTGLIAHYPFNGNLNDVSGNNLNLSVVSGTASYTGGGLTFSGGTTRFDSPTNNLLANDGDHTFSFYFKQTTAEPSFGKLFTWAPAGDRSPGIFLLSQGFHWRYDSDAIPCCGAGGNTGVDYSAINLNEWYHVVGVKEGTTFTYYVTNSAGAQATISGGGLSDPTRSGTAPFVFGAFGGNNAPVGAVIREFKIFNRALSAAEIPDLGQWKWYTASCGGTLVGAGPAITVNPSVTTEYFLRAENGCGDTYCVGYTFAGAPAYTAGNISVGPRMTSAANQQVGAVEPTLLPDASITASHQLTGHEVWRGRLFNQYWYAPDGGGANSQATSWASANGAAANYVQIDLGQNSRISGVITQSRGYDWYPPAVGVMPYNQRVARYTVQYSTDGTTWQNVDNGATFTANTAFNQDPVTNLFQQICNGRYVRINIPATEFFNHMSARVDVISHPCTDAGPYNINASASIPKDIHGRQGAYTIRWYTASSAGTLVGTGQRITRSLAANATETLYAATYFNDGAGNTCESTLRTPVTLSAEVLYPGTQASIPTQATNFATTVPAGWRTGNSVTDSRTLDCSGRAAVLDQLGDYVWVRTNASANYLDYTLKVTGTGILQIQQSQDGCVWTTVATHTNAPTAITKHQQISLLNTTRHVRFHIIGNGATFEVDNIRLYNTPPVVSLSDNGDQVVCEVYGNHWVDFLTSDDQLIVSVRGNNNDLGNVTARTYIDAITTSPYANPIMTEACGNSGYTTAAVGRHWTIDPTNNAAATVRLPYYKRELDLLIPETATSTNPDDGVSGQTDLGLSKYSGPNNVNGLWNDNCPPPVSTGNGNTTWKIYDAVGTVGAYVTGFPNAVANNQGLYSEFNITSFSEFWLHASNLTTPSPLSVVLSDFNAYCEGQKIRVTWSTASEQNSDYFTLERSRDGYNWEQVTEIDGAGTTSLTNFYEVMDNNHSNVYYRLKQTDFDGKTENFGPINVDCGPIENGLIVYPNPNNGIFTVAVNTSEELGEATISISDVSGKIVASRNLNILSGTNTLHFESNNLTPGTYIVSVHSKNKHTLIPVKLIVW